MIGIVQYGAGNIFSLTSALNRLGINYGMIDKKEDFERYDRYIIPGVGHAGAAMSKLQQTGLVPDIQNLTKPTLGICVGMQLLTSHSEEGDADLLNISSKALAKITRHYFHKTLTDLISDRIVIEAKRELYLTPKTIKEVAYELGFEDEFYFSRFFKRHTTVSPHTYRDTVGFNRAASSSVLESNN